MQSGKKHKIKFPKSMKYVFADEYLSEIIYKNKKKNENLKYNQATGRPPNIKVASVVKCYDD